MRAIDQKLNSRNLPWPVDWTALFGEPRPLILEIGFGRGDFLLHLAETYSDHNLIGVEVSNRSLVSAEEKITRRGLSHVRVIHSPAVTALTYLFDPASLAQLHVNFPDPWFKSRHERRRLMQRANLDLMVNRLAPGGLFYLATDIRDYAEMSAELLTVTAGLDNLLPAPWVYDLPERGVVTKYEQKARREGRPCHYFAYRRNDQPAPPAPPIEELDMPHCVFAAPLTLDDMMAAFAPLSDSEGDTHVKLMYAYRGAYALLVEAYVKEPTIEQHVVFQVLTRKTPNEFTLQLSTIGQPRPTPGIHRAAGCIANWLLSLHPDAQVLKWKIGTGS
jgi:tRNA (guanine-N7-)-methyltransferase